MSDLRRIPGVGKDMEQHLLALGIGCIADLRDADPEELYRGTAPCTAPPTAVCCMSTGCAPTMPPAPSMTPKS